MYLSTCEVFNSKFSLRKKTNPLVDSTNFKYSCGQYIWLLFMTEFYSSFFLVLNVWIQFAVETLQHCTCYLWQTMNSSENFQPCIESMAAGKAMVACSSTKACRTRTYLLLVLSLLALVRADACFIGTMEYGHWLVGRLILFSFVFMHVFQCLFAPISNFVFDVWLSFVRLQRSDGLGCLSMSTPPWKGGSWNKCTL